ncbi:hypothetical protein AB0392_49920 [Nonomuraea angiospora]|uniref:hypothetical protein n=1 Tax=Nonomuraea angiospora TaxID=46172 RepID=UPI0034508BE4
MRVAILGPLEVESAAVGGARLRRTLPEAGGPAAPASELGEQAFAAAFARGRALDRARAVELAAGGPG